MNLSCNAFKASKYQYFKNLWIKYDIKLIAIQRKFISYFSSVILFMDQNKGFKFNGALFYYM